jgi:galactonate dehydratase
MKITDIDTIMINSPGRKWTIVRVHTDEGLVGLGEATYSNKEPAVCAAVDNMKLELLGEDPARIEYLWHKIFYESSVSGIWRMSGPIWQSALSGIDQALWDLKGKVAGLPVVDLLGGRYRDAVQVYTHFGNATPEAAAAMAKEKVAEGFTALKSGPSGSGTTSDLRLDPYGQDVSPQLTADVYAAVREAVGPDVKLLIDCHGRFTVAGVVRMGRALEPYDLYVLEDPVAPDDLAIYAQVRRELDIPIMGSERLNTKTQFRILLDHDGVDVAQPDLMYAGGITEVRKIAAIADTHLVPISPHNTKGPIGILAAAHLMASIPNAAPMELVTGIDWRDDILTEPLRIENSAVWVPNKPGFGVELDMEGVEKHRWRAGDPR